MADSTSAWAQPASWIAVFIAGIAGIFKLGTMKQQLDEHEQALKVRVTQETFAVLTSQLTELHEDVREIRALLENRRLA